MAWTIERVVMGDFTRDNSMLRLEKGLLYGSGQYYGGHETFYVIDPRSLKLHDLSIPVSTGVGVMNEKFLGTTLTAGNDKDDTSGVLHPSDGLLHVQLWEWCSANPGEVVTIGCPGARGAIKDVRRYQVRDYGRVFMRSNNGNCVLASLANAVDIIYGRGRAEMLKASMLEDKVRVLFRKEIVALIKRNNLKLQVQRIPKGEREESLNAGRMQWFVKKGKGKWLVRVEAEQRVDHCFVVNGERGVIIDSSEPYPLRLSVETMQLMDGSAVRNLTIGEMWKLCVEPKKITGKRAHQVIA